MMMIDGNLAFVRATTPWFPHAFGGDKPVEFVRLVLRRDPDDGPDVVLAEDWFTTVLSDGMFRYACEALIAEMAGRLTRNIPEAK